MASKYEVIGHSQHLPMRRPSNPQCSLRQEMPCLPTSSTKWQRSSHIVARQPTFLTTEDMAIRMDRHTQQPLSTITRNCWPSSAAQVTRTSPFMQCPLEESLLS